MAGPWARPLGRVKLGVEDDAVGPGDADGFGPHGGWQQEHEEDQGAHDAIVTVPAWSLYPAAGFQATYPA